MVSRRGYLTAMGTGSLAGLAGCTGLLSKDGEGSSSVVDALLAEQFFESVGGEGDWPLRDAEVHLRAADAAALREHRDEIDDGFAATGYADVAASPALANAIETVDDSAYVQYRGETIDSNFYFVERDRGYVSGTVDPADYESAVDATPSDEGETE